MEIQELLNKLPKVQTNRNYWFFRTNGGSFYESFIRGNFVAIGYNFITLEDLSKSNTYDATGLEILTENIRNKHPEETRAKYSAHQLLKFNYDIKKNDIVLIPSNSSQEITFGEIQETPAFNEFDGKFDCPYVKRKKVKWLKSVNRESLDPNLYKLMFSHHTISEANLYVEQIDKEINSFFVKGEKAHLVLGVQTLNPIKAKDLFELGTLSLELFDDFIKEESLDIESENFNVKLNVQSPGFIEISGEAIAGIVILGVMIVGIAGGGFEFSYKDSVKSKIKTDGLIEKIRKFVTTKSNNNVKKKLLEKHIKNLDIKDPSELIEVLKQLDK